MGPMERIHTCMPSIKTYHIISLSRSHCPANLHDALKQLHAGSQQDLFAQPVKSPHHQNDQRKNSNRPGWSPNFVSVVPAEGFGSGLGGGISSPAGSSWLEKNPGWLDHSDNELSPVP
eukprot:EG_transcript_23004